MLKPLLILFFILFNYTANNAFAQATGRESLSTSTEKNYKWGIGVQVNTIEQSPSAKNIRTETNEIRNLTITKNKSFAIGLVGSYFFNENKFIKLRTGITEINITEHYDSYNQIPQGSGIGERVISDEATKQTRFNFAPGIAWEIKKNKFTFYTGFEIPFTFFGNLIGKNVERMEDSLANITYAGNGTVTVPGGFSIGPGAFAGFHITLLKHLSLGGEFSFAFLYSKVGGEIKDVGNVTIPVNEPYTVSYIESVENFAISKQRVALSIIYLF